MFEYDSRKGQLVGFEIERVYGNLDGEALFNHFVSRLYYDLFNPNGELLNLLYSIYRSVEIFELEDGWEEYLFDNLIYLLDKDEITAKRLYNCFTEYNSLKVFVRIMQSYAEYLSDDELAEVKKIGFETFDSEILASYGITEDYSIVLLYCEQKR